MFVPLQVDLGENIAHRAEKLYISLTEVSPNSLPPAVDNQPEVLVC